MANKKPNWGAWLLKFVGSLVYLYVIAQLWQPGAVSGTFGPVLFGLAVVFAVTLFLGSLAALAMPNDKMGMWQMKAGFAAGFALIALVGPLANTWSLIALVGFVLTQLGSGMDMM